MHGKQLVNYYPLIKRLLFGLDAENAHDLALFLLKATSPTWLVKRRIQKFPSYPVRLLGLNFPNPVGLAAGFDKNSDYLHALSGLGFGFIEVGTVTPKPQFGSPKPRLFRLPSVSGIINRMGFNNLGVDHLVHQLQQRRISGIVGANIGKNANTPLERAAEDYCYCLRKVYPYADYITVNISSPNTPGLRELQSPKYLHDLLTELDKTQTELISSPTQAKRPLFIKIDPDLNDFALQQLINIVTQHRVDGFIATNTTIDHHTVAHLPEGHQLGGLSGSPLRHQATQVVQKLSKMLEGQLPIIATGGILTVEDALEKFAAGASLIQLYSGLIYQGPGLIRDIVLALAKK